MVWIGPTYTESVCSWVTNQGLYTLRIIFNIPNEEKLYQNPLTDNDNNIPFD
jgi:hypothetical protein